MSKVSESTEKKIEPEVDPGLEYVPYKLQRDPRRKGERGIYVGVNQMRVFVPYGQEVQIPRCIAEVIDHSIAQDEATANKIMDLESKANF